MASEDATLIATAIDNLTLQVYNLRQSIDTLQYWHNYALTIINGNIEKLQYENLVIDLGTIKISVQGRNLSILEE